MKSLESQRSVRRAGSGVAALLMVQNVFAGVEAMRIPLLANPEQAPVIDGEMQPGEWQYALSMTGIIASDGALAQRQATIYYVADAQWLYIGAFAASVPAGTAPEVRPEPKYDGQNYMDFSNNDRVEVKFIPPKRKEVGDYIFVADAAGHTFTEVNTDFGKPIRGAWEYRTSHSPEGWTVEMRVPFTQFGQAVAQDGDAWRVNFTYARLFPLKYEGLSGKGPHGSCDALLAAGAPAVQIERLGNLPKGQLDLSVSVREYEGVVAAPKEGAYDERRIDAGGLALQGSGQAARVSWELLDAEGTTVARDAQVLALRPAEKVAATFGHEFRPAAANTLKLAVELAASAKAFEESGNAAEIVTLYRANLPFRPYNQDEETAWQERLRRGTVPGSWRFNPAFFPYWEKAKVQIVFFQGALREQARKVRITVTSDQGFHAVREVPVRDGLPVLDAPDQLLDIPVPGLPAGVYRAHGEVLDADGKVLASQEQSYTRTVFPWEHNTLGLSRGVIKPWTPMAANGKVVSCWGRDLTLSDAGLAAQIESQGKPLLSGPVTLELQPTEGPELRLQETGSLQFDEKAEDRVAWRGQGQLGPDVAVTVNAFAEYDGFVWHELTLRPSKPVAFASGRLVVPLTEAQAQLMHAQPQWARNNFSGAVPSGRGVVYQSLGTNGKQGGFTPHVWIGNPTRGLSWFADSPEGWTLAADRSALEVVRTDGQVHLVLNVLSGPGVLDTPRTLRFGLMATPFKPTMPIRDITTKAVNWIGEGGHPGGGIQAFMYALYPLNFDYSLIDRNMRGCRLYFNKHEMGAALPELAVFDNEWGGMQPPGDYPGEIKRFGPGILSRTVNRNITDSRTDMMVYYIAELARKSTMAATYWDLTGIGNSGTMLENGAFRDPRTGVVQSTADILKARQLFKRVATMWQELKGEPDRMEIHSTNHMAIPFYSFAYSWLNFEWLWPSAKALRPDGRWMDFIDLRPLDLFATEGSPSQFGVWINSINAGGRPEEPAEFRRVSRSGTALSALHNHSAPGMGGSGLNQPPNIGRRDEVEFVGYWDELGRVATDQPKVLASFWHAPDKLEVVVVNLDLEPRTVTVSIPLGPLGWSDAGQVVETTTEKELEQKRGQWLRTKRPDLAEQADAVLAAVRTGRSAPAVNTEGGVLRLTLDLPSHDFRTFTADAVGERKTPVAAPPSEPKDVFAPWRRTSEIEAPLYETAPEPSGVVSLKPDGDGVVSLPDETVRFPFGIEAPATPLSETDGIEATLRFRVDRVPPARLDASQSLALVSLQGATGQRGFYLHAYAPSSAFCLNGISKTSPTERLLLSRGAANPQSGHHWDTQWHTVRLAWCQGRLAASWDGFPILHLVGPEIDYKRLVLEWVKPGAAFGALSLEPVTWRRARFAPLEEAQADGVAP